MKFLLDFGHCNAPGTADTGARDQFVEENETRNLGKVVKSKLEALGHTAVIVSVDFASTLDESLSARVNNANREGGDLYVSFHFNSFPNAKGHEVYCLQLGSDGEKYARAVNNELAKLNFTVNRGVKTANYYVLRNTKMSAILIETCFVQNPDATNYNRENCANAIVRGLTGQEPVASNNTNDSTTTEIYRVRSAYDNVSSQIGAFSDLEKAKALADAHPGYSVYDSKFNRVYPTESSSQTTIAPTQPVQPRKPMVVCYGNEIDKRAAEYIRDFYNCDIQDANKPFDYSIFDRVVACGGNPTEFNGQWSSFTTDFVKGENRYKTVMEALKFIGEL